MSKYLDADIAAVRIARWYSNQTSTPFIAIVGDFSDYDVASIDRSIRIEIKTETTPVRTGNLAFEVMNTSLGRPSGVMATAATHWLHIIPEGGLCIGYEFEVDVLKVLVEKEGVIKSNGRNSLCKIIPLEVARQYAHRSIDMSGVLKLEGI